MKEPNKSRRGTSHPQRQEQLKHTNDALREEPDLTAGSSQNVPLSNGRAMNATSPGTYRKVKISNMKCVVVLNKEVLKSVSNARIILMHGNDLERTAVLHHFPILLDFYQRNTMYHLVDCISSECMS